MLAEVQSVARSSHATAPMPTCQGSPDLPGKSTPHSTLCTSLPTHSCPGYSDLQPSVSRIAVDLLSCQLACETAGEQGARGGMELDPAGWGRRGDCCCSLAQPPPVPLPLSLAVCTSFLYNEISKLCELRSGECPSQQTVSEVPPACCADS